MFCQVLIDGFPLWRPCPIAPPLLEPLLDPAHLRTRADAPDGHDLLARDQRREPGRALRADLFQAGLKLVELFGLGIGGGGDVSFGQGEQTVEQGSGVPREAADRAIRPLRPVKHRPAVQVDQPDDALDLPHREAQPLERGPGATGPAVLVPDARAIPFSLPRYPAV